MAVADNLPPPMHLSPKNKHDFASYLASPPHKAFAIAINGAFGWRSGRYSVAEAKSLALATCEKYASGDCEIYAVDNEKIGE